MISSEVGGDKSDVSPTPEPGNRFRFRLRLRCVRACERSCVREMIPLWLGVGGEICGVAGPVRSGPVRAPVPIKSSSFSSSDRCFVISLTQCIFLWVGRGLVRVFRACFVGGALLDRGLGPPVPTVAVLIFRVSQSESE